MSIYTCNVCGKSTHINTSSSIVHTNCLLTANCRGKLYKNFSTSNNYELTSQLPRLKLEVRHQPLLSTNWSFQVPTNTLPSIFVYKKVTQKDTQRMTTGYKLTINDGSINITFETPQSGYVHLIYNSSLNNIVVETIPDNDFTITSNSILTIASNANLPNLQKDISYIDPTTNTAVNTNITLLPHKFDAQINLFNTPWKNCITITINGKKHHVYSCILTNQIPSIPTLPITINLNNDFILLSNAPKSEFVDISTTTAIQVETLSGYITPSELVIDSSAVNQYYPPIIINSTLN